MKHLTSREISEWVSGERGAQWEQHVTACDRCRSEIAKIEGALTLFRTALHESAATYMETARPLTMSRPAVAKPMSFPKLYWGLAVAVACLVLTFSVVTPWNRQVEQDSAAADAKLLSQIDAALSRDVPQPMEPLAKLVAWDGSTDEKTKP